MSGTRNYSIFVSCQINSSEDPLKIKTALFNVFPDLKFSVNDQQIIGKSSHTNSLSKFSESMQGFLLFDIILLNSPGINV